MLREYYDYFSKVPLATDQSKSKKEKYVVTKPDKDRGFKCGKCKFTSTDKAAYLEHLRKFHSKDNGNNSKDKDTKKCRYCDKKFTSKNELNHHLRSTHPATYKCIFCNDEFNNSHDAHSHLKMKHSQKLIDMDGGTYPNLEKRRRYVKVEWTCIHCGEKFRFEKHYKEHFMHHVICFRNGVQCLICEDYFPTIQRCADHILHDHDFKGKEHLIERNYRKVK